jgi:hypothetical protein
MSKHWFEYVKSCYDLVIESESRSNIILDHDVEAYVVHLMARNFERINIGNEAVAMQLLLAVNSNRKENLLSVGDECLLIHSYPLRRNKWPSETYYKDMGTTAYGLAEHIMEENFEPAGEVLKTLFNYSPAVLKL